MSLAALAAIGLCLLGGCRERAPAQQVADQAPAEAVAKPRIEVGVSGCAGLVQDADERLLCLTRGANQPKPLHLWLQGARDPEIELRFSGAVIEAKRTIDKDGVMLSVELPEQKGQLELSTEDGLYAVGVSPVSERFETLRKEVQESWKAGDAAAALQMFEHGTAELAEHEATLLACSVGKVLLATGDYERVLAIVNRVSQSATLSCVGKASLLAAYLHIYLRPNFNAAELHLQAADAVSGVDLDTRIGTTYLRGVLQHWLGQIDESLTTFERTARLAWLIGDDEQYASALVMQAFALARLGRFTEAEALASQVEQRVGRLDPSVAANIRSNIGWITVLRREDNPSISDPSPALRLVLSTYEERGDRRHAATQRLDLALALVQNGQLSEAEKELGALETDALSPDLLVWLELTLARIGLLRGHFGVVEKHLERAEVLAELNQDRELEWRVVIAKGELARARNQPAIAIERFREASRIADELARSVAGDAGRSLFVTTHSRADMALTELLLARGDVEEAMCTAVAARARHLRGLWARFRPPLSETAEQSYRDLLSRHHQRKQEILARLEGSWELSTQELQDLRKRLDAEGERADELLARATALLEEGVPSWSCERVLPQQPGTAVLTMMPSFDGDRWTAILARRMKAGDLVLNFVDLKNQDLIGVAASIIESFDGLLGQVEHVQVIPVGAFVDVDFQALLLTRAKIGPTVTYSLGLGTADDLAPLERRAAVVAGSTNLATINHETAAVAQRLDELGWIVDSHWSPTADRQPSLLHYAGHGFDGGPLGWQSAIDVPGVGRVSAAQIVAGQRSPDLVVLGACGAGQVAAEAIDGGMNLAAAFLLAGARLVIAPTQDVDDKTAYELGLRLYSDLGIDPVDALPRTLARLQKEQFERDGAADAARSYGSWRAWTP